MTNPDSKTKPTGLDREFLMTYLGYVLDELEQVNETSAALVKMAILSLGDETSVVPSEAGHDPLFG